MSEAARSPRQGWLFGAAPDLLLGCGLAYLFVAGVHLFLGGELVRWVPGGLLILAFSLPHYGATLVRVYQSRDDRTKYRLFAVHATVALLLCLAVGSHVALLGSLLLTVYLTWSPWHYTGQNYGIALMLLARRGIRIDAATKRWIYGSFIASYALTFVAIHGAAPAGSYAPVEYGGALYRMLPLGIPAQVVDPLLAALALGYGVLLVTATVRLVRAGSLAALGPAAMLVLTQAMWFSVPVLLRLTGALAASPGPANPFSAYGFIWVAAAHSAQYLWITTYYATSERTSTRAGFLAKSALAGFAAWTLPALLFAPGLLGGVSYDSGLALLIASVVNLHHFILDGAIWKLRDGAVARVLLRPVEATSDAVGDRGERAASWARPALVLAGGLSIAIALFAFVESEYGFYRALARGDVARAETALERFAWIGRDGAAKRTEVARTLAEAGEYERARAHLERSLEVEPTYRAQYMLGLVHEQRGDWRAALAAHDVALAMQPGASEARVRRALALVELGRPAEALSELEPLVAAEPQNQAARRALARARIALREEPPTDDAAAPSGVGAAALP